MKLIFSILLLVSSAVYAQQKIDLDDIDIKGDLLGDDRIKMLNREKNELRNFVKFRKDYRKEIIEGLEKPHPKFNY